MELYAGFTQSRGILPGRRGNVQRTRRNTAIPRESLVARRSADDAACQIHVCELKIGWQARPQIYPRAEVSGIPLRVRGADHLEHLFAIRIELLLTHAADAA